MSLFTSLTAEQLRCATSAEVILPTLFREKKPYQFKRPSANDNTLAVMRPNMVRPEGEMPVIHISMPVRTIIPFHAHETRRKTYVFPGSGCFSIHLYNPDPPTGVCNYQHIQVAGYFEMVKVPPKVFHAIVCHSSLSDSERPHFFMHPSHMDAEDIEWEPDLQKLLAAANHRVLLP